jgi:hypothetical protein
MLADVGVGLLPLAPVQVRVGRLPTNHSDSHPCLGFAHPSPVPGSRLGVCFHGEPGVINFGGPHVIRAPRPHINIFLGPPL